MNDVYDLAKLFDDHIDKPGLQGVPFLVGRFFHSSSFRVPQFTKAVPEVTAWRASVTSPASKLVL
jgi:hypothetical protein